jgi:hypothetical protein
MLEALEERTLLDTGLTGGGLSHDNLQPSIALNYIIAVDGEAPQSTGTSSGAGGDVRVLSVRLQNLLSRWPVGRGAGGWYGWPDRRGG